MAERDDNGDSGKSSLGSLPATALIGLVFGLIIGVAFSFLYPETEITANLGLLFALAGLVL
ncbi:MAG: hypothetical protein K8F57_04535, partial [Alphaproteobacteria bacterium]|nr:hypothetical protein [Alphaproteobacteria bacterium]